MTAIEQLDEGASRPAWLTTLADLALLLVGFFVFLQSNQIDAKTLAASFRAGFDAREAAAMPVDLATVSGFATGSARVGAAAAAIDWARTAATDPRTRLLVTGEVDGTAADVDPETGSASILAADRARAAAALLVRAGAVDPARIAIATGTGTGQRRAVLTLGYDGGRQ